MHYCAPKIAQSFLGNATSAVRGISNGCVHPHLRQGATCGAQIEGVVHHHAPEVALSFLGHGHAAQLFLCLRWVTSQGCLGDLDAGGTHQWRANGVVIRTSRACQYVERIKVTLFLALPGVK